VFFGVKNENKVLSGLRVKENIIHFSSPFPFPLTLSIR
jgi:hypothetical protein